MYIYIEESDFLEMLLERIKCWTEDYVTIDLFKSMYEKYLDDGVFEETKNSINEIVDDDYINWCRVIDKNDKEEFEKLLTIYQNQGVGDCSCICDFASFIETVDNENNPTAFLIRC